MIINSFDDLAKLILSDELTNKQVSEVVQSTLGLLLAFDEEELPREQLVETLRVHHEKWKDQQITPLFLNLDLSLSVN